MCGDALLKEAGHGRKWLVCWVMVEDRGFKEVEEEGRLVGE